MSVVLAVVCFSDKVLGAYRWLALQHLWHFVNIAHFQWIDSQETNLCLYHGAGELTVRYLL